MLSDQRVPRPLLPGDRWQCDECKKVWVWAWRSFAGEYAWHLEMQ